MPMRTASVVTTYQSLPILVGREAKRDHTRNIEKWSDLFDCGEKWGKPRQIQHCRTRASSQSAARQCMAVIKAGSPADRPQRQSVFIQKPTSSALATSSDTLATKQRCLALGRSCSMPRKHDHALLGSHSALWDIDDKSRPIP